MPMLIRPTGESPGTFHVVGICFVPGLMDGEALLGSLPDQWQLQMVFENGSYVPNYLNTETRHCQHEDPRLQPLNANWEQFAKRRGQDDPYFLGFFKDIRSGRIVNSDPRLCPRALQELGVNLETFNLS